MMEPVRKSSCHDHPLPLSKTETRCRGSRAVALLALALCLALTPLSATVVQTAYRCRIVDYGADVGDGYYRETIPSKTRTSIALDVDGDGQTADDSVALQPYSLDLPLTPGWANYDHEAVNAIFYGGMVIYFANKKNGCISEGFINQNHELRDDFNFMGGSTGPGQQSRAYAVYIWKKEDFLNGGDAHRVTFDDQSLFGVHISRYWDGIQESRGVVRDGNRFYISEAVCEGVRKSHLFRPTRTRWAPYTPKPPHEIEFDAKTAPFSERVFENVTAIGFYLARPELCRTSQQLKWHAFEAYAVVNRPRVASFHADMVAVPADAIPQSANRKARVPLFFMSTTELPYALWKKIRKWSVSNQYLFDLKTPGYIFDADGDMGSMALCNGAYGADEPVTGMTWLDAVAWCNAFSEYEGRTPCYYHDVECTQVLRKVIERDKPDAYDWQPDIHVKWDADGYRLPTVAEWRRAAGNDYALEPDKAWIGANAEGRTHPVGVKPTNALGLHDMAGNVWEWVWTSAAREQAGATALGGGFRYPADPSASGLIGCGETPWLGNYNLGLRLVRRETGAVPPPVDDKGSVPSWTVARDKPVPGSGADVEAPALDMVVVPEGGYLREDEAWVALSPFSMSATEVTFRQFRQVHQWAAVNGYALDGDGDMGSMDWQTGLHRHEPDEPVTDISWHTAMAWCNALSEMTGRTPCYYTDEAKTAVCRQPNRWRIAMYRGMVGYVTGKHERRWLPLYVKWDADGFRLPTEAEWIYAFRAGWTNVGAAVNWVVPENADAFGWIAANSDTRTHPVAAKQPNPYGLYDLVGNIREWTWDWPGYDYYRPRNPKGGDDYELFGKRLCGSDYRTSAERAASTKGWQEDPSVPRPWYGLRVVRCEQGVHPEQETFEPRVVLDIDPADYNPLQGRVHRANLRRDGHFTTAGLPQCKGIKWSFRTGGRVRSSPVVVGSIAYVGSDDKHVYALDTASGSPKWTFTAKGPVMSSAAVVDDVVYIGDSDGNLYALDAASGDNKWRFRRGHHRPSHASPGVAFGVVFAQFGQYGNGGFSGIDIAEQREVWRFRKSAGPADRSAPAILGGQIYMASPSIHGNLADIRTELPVWHSHIGASLVVPVLTEDSVILADRWLTALDRATGKQRWTFRTQAPMNKGFRIHASPTVADNRVFLGTDYKRMYAIDLHSGKELWRFDTDGEVQSDPGVAAGVVYFGSTDQHVYALDAASGALKWKYKLDAWINTAPWLDDGVLYVGCDDGKVVALH